MYFKRLYVITVAFLVLHCADGRKSKKNKRPPVDNENNNIQPNVVAHSTFGFHDVGSYDGFVPSSPDHASFHSGVNQESTTRLYAPAFPTALEATGFESNYGSQPFDGNPFSAIDDGGQQSSMLYYPQNTMNLFNTPSLDDNEGQNKNTGFDETYRQNTDEANAPVYGTKLSSRNRNKYLNQFNNTENNAYHSAYPNVSDESHETKPTSGESNANYHNVPNYSSIDVVNFMKPMPGNIHSQLKFQKMVDLTKMKPYYPTALDNYPTTPKDPNAHNYYSNIQTENSYVHPNEDHGSHLIRPTPTFKDAFDFETNEEVTEINVMKPNSVSNQGFLYNYGPSHTNNNTPSPQFNSHNKKKFRKNPWILRNNNTNNVKNLEDGNEYTTNNIKTSFKYGFDESKKPFTSNTDEIEPAIVDFSNYQFKDTDFSTFKKIPEVHYDDDFTDYKDSKSKYNDLSNSYPSLFSTAPTTTSYWGNALKSSDYASFKNKPNTPYTDDLNDEIVNIPRRPHKFSHGKPLEKKPIDWPYGYHRPYKSSKPPKDWNEQVSTRFKSEEDLLDLRNHDTSHPSYLPTYKPTQNNVVSDDNANAYKEIIEKWRQSYLRSKYKESVLRDYEDFETGTKTFHVPVPKPNPIEIPYPVIVPVPQRYPVHVPVFRPIAVPVVRELTFTIEKPVPYPVFKKVPYPVVKFVPVPVEKEVAVSVLKPYPVHIPYDRPVFHHTRPTYDVFEFDHGVDDDYSPRPESSQKYVQYRKRPHGSKNRPRRPTRTSYQDRNRRRRPERPVSSIDQRYKVPNKQGFHSPLYKHHDFESELPGDDHSVYFLYCKRNGNC